MEPGSRIVFFTLLGEPFLIVLVQNICEMAMSLQFFGRFTRHMFLIQLLFNPECNAHVQWIQILVIILLGFNRFTYIFLLSQSNPPVFARDEDRIYRPVNMTKFFINKIDWCALR